MKKRFLILFVLILCLCASAALAQTEAEFNRGCWVKTASGTTLYRQADPDAGLVVGTTTDLSANFVECGSLAAGTYLKINATVSGYDLVSFWGGSGYIKSSAVTSATTHVKLDDGSSVEVAEAMAKDTGALLEYLRSTYPGRTFSVIEGSSTIHVSGAATSSKTNKTSSSKTANSSAATLTPPTVYYTDASGAKCPVALVQLALGYSTILMDGEEVIVPTSSVSWDTEAKKSKVLALVNAGKTGEAPMMNDSKKTADKLCDLTTGTVVAVMKVGSTYTRVYAEGKVGFVKTNSLSFQANKERSDVQLGYLAYHNNLKSKNEINVRSSGKKGARIVGTYPSGTPIVILSKGKTWTEIQVGSLHCFALTEYIVTGENPSDVTVDPDKAMETVTEAADAKSSKNDSKSSKEEKKSSKDKNSSKKPSKQTIVVGESNTIGYGSYEMNSNYVNGADYEDENRFFFDEEY